MRFIPSQSVFRLLRGGILFLAFTISFSAIAQTGSVVTVDADKVLVLNGRKVFPIGFSPGPPTNGKTPDGNDALQEFHDAGALLFRITQTINWNSQLITNQQAALDWAAQHGMYCWLNLRELSKFAAGDTNTEASLRNIVDTFKNHPALGLWKNFDEAWWGGVSAADLQRGYNVIKQQDTNHPIVQTHAPRGTVSDLQPYNVATDILALDIYPVGVPPGANSLLTNKEISMVGDYTQFLDQVGNGQKEIWMIEQIAWSGVTPPSKTLVFPTLRQERYMAYQAIINGARGLMFFGGNVAATLNAQDAALGWNWTFWNEVLKPVVRQLGDNSVLAATLVQPNSTLPITISGATSPDLEFCVREASPYLYILASKREGATVNVTFNGLPSWVAGGEVLYELPRTVLATNGQFSDVFAPFDVHVYRFSQTNQVPNILVQPRSRTNFSATAATFSVTADGTGPLTYQWKKDGSNVVDGSNIFGATSPDLTLSNVLQANAGNYTVVVGGYGSVTSAPATLTVISNQAPIIITPPRSRTNDPGTTATFSITVAGSGPFTYQWRKNGSNLADNGTTIGSTLATLTLSNVALSDAAGYTVAVTGYGSITSAPPATLTVVSPPSNSLILYEPFDYTNIGGQVGSNTPANWTYNGSGTNDLNVTSENLAYAGLRSSTGNSVTNGGIGLGVRRLFGTVVSTGAVYFSALFRINDLGYGVWNGAASQVGALTAPDNTSFRLAVMVQSNSPISYLIGAQKGGTGATTTLDATAHSAGQTIFLVGKYDFGASPNRVSLWINPPASTFGNGAEPTSGFTSATTGTDGFTIDRFNMRQNTVASVPAAMQWDELRIANSWAAVTPPTSMLLTDVRKPGSFQFSYTNSNNQSYTVYASTNLTTWSSIGTATQSPPGWYKFIDTSPTNYSKRFYQLRSP